MNPYLEEFTALSGETDEGRFSFMRPTCDRRAGLTAKYAWAVPTDEAIDAVVALSPLVEIGAGTGY